jgi:hypothetical protein
MDNSTGSLKTISKGKCKLYPRTGHEGSTLSLTSALVGGSGWSTPRPVPRKDPVPTIGGWVSLRAGLDRCGKSRLHRDLIPGPSSS